MLPILLILAAAASSAVPARSPCNFDPRALYQEIDAHREWGADQKDALLNEIDKRVRRCNDLAVFEQNNPRRKT